MKVKDEKLKKPYCNSHQFPSSTVTLDVTPHEQEPWRCFCTLSEMISTNLWICSTVKRFMLCRIPKNGLFYDLTAANQQLY